MAAHGSPNAHAGQEPSRGVGVLEAATTTLQSHPMLQAEQQRVQASRAIRLQASGKFDSQVTWSAEHRRSNSPLTDSARLSLQQSGSDLANESLNVTTVTAEFSRLFRSGLSVGPRLEIVRSEGNLYDIDGASRARLSFDVNMPLLRGRGRDVVASGETSAVLNVEASALDLNQAAAGLLLATATAYWRYVGAVRQLEIVSGAEARAREYVQNVETLVRADKIPRSELFQVRANLAGRAADRIYAEQQVAESRDALALAMGLPTDQVNEVPPPSDAFPAEPADDASLAPARVPSYVAMAIAGRADCLAAETRKRSADVARRASSNGVKPQLDLVLSTGFAGLHEGGGPREFLGSVFTRAQGPDLAFGLRFSQPASNTTARGQLAEAEASYQQAALVSAETARQAAAAVSIASSSVTLGTQRVRKAREAVSLYESALEAEQDKLRLAAGSLTDLLTVEDRLTSALGTLVAAQEAFATAIARFRHATGTLVPADRTALSIDRDSFFTLPALRTPR
jgi:outer membrane protein TolC